MKELANLLEVLRSRAPWRTVAAPLLKSVGFTVKRGVEDTIEEILADEGSAARLNELRNAMAEHLVAGEKLLRVYEADGKKRERLIAWSTKKQRGSSPLVESYLGVPDSSVLAEQEDQAPQFIATREADDGIAAIFTASRSYTRRVPLAPADLRPTLDVSVFEKIYGVTKVRAQTYDVLWIPYEEDYIYIACDSPEEAPVEFGELSALAIQAMVIRALSDRVTPANLWPSIEGLYQTPSGSCVELGFLTDTDSVKMHKSRKRGKCLRKDKYHIGGASVVGANLHPYRVAMRWKHRLSEELVTAPEVQLPGTARAAFKPNPELNHAFVRNCLNIRDLRFVLSKIVAHI